MTVMRVLCRVAPVSRAGNLRKRKYPITTPISEWGCTRGGFLHTYICACRRFERAEGDIRKGGSRAGGKKVKYPPTYVPVHNPHSSAIQNSVFFFAPTY